MWLEEPDLRNFLAEENPADTLTALTAFLDERFVQSGANRPGMLDLRSGSHHPRRSSAMPDGKPQNHGPVYIHEDEMDWETLRFPGQHSKMVFHPTPEDPAHPNAGFVRYEPGAHHPRHRHDFAQVWYVLEGEFKIGARTVGPGTVVFHADPHYEEDLSTRTGGLMFFVQYQGPTTGGRPIYDGRFNVTERKPLSEERLDV